MMNDIINDDRYFEERLNEYKLSCLLTESVIMESAVGDIFKSIIGGVEKLLLSISDTLCSAIGTTSNRNAVDKLKEDIRNNPEKGSKVVKVSDTSAIMKGYSSILEYYGKKTSELLNKSSNMTQSEISKEVSAIIKTINDSEKKLANTKCDTRNITVNELLKMYGSNGSGFTKSIKDARELYRKRFSDITLNLKRIAGDDPIKINIVSKISVNAGKATAMSYRGMLKGGIVSALAGIGIGVAVVAAGSIKPVSMNTNYIAVSKDKKGKPVKFYSSELEKEKFNSTFAKMSYNKFVRAYRKGENSNAFKKIINDPGANKEFDAAWAYAKAHKNENEFKIMEAIAKKLPDNRKNEVKLTLDGKEINPGTVFKTREKLRNKK